eukprot:CAMPEP_0117423536 /NCGR_PEP_ID=MMETSP0758-20121206/4134_1 /TAXON_ID=63605 /ORGANISM="Percolomonas cosmopolitus, Strain AE-1 (ATCC 50343)" /LENGTH=1410 /DNA_ID=CAMNT_0005206771 /DNA_START=28 /DNA_END=4260 /DNA_ORIENTATION=+
MSRFIDDAAEEVNDQGKVVLDEEESNSESENEYQEDDFVTHEEVEDNGIRPRFDLDEEVDERPQKKKRLLKKRIIDDDDISLKSQNNRMIRDDDDLNDFIVNDDNSAKITMSTRMNRMGDDTIRYEYEEHILKAEQMQDQEVELEKVLRPEQLSKMYATEADKEIIQTDLPERFQLLGLKSTKGMSISEIHDEAQWMIDMEFIENQEYFVQTKLEEESGREDQMVDVTQNMLLSEEKQQEITQQAKAKYFDTITKVINQFALEKLDPGHVVAYREDVYSECFSPEEVWFIFDNHVKYVKMQNSINSLTMDIDYQNVVLTEDQKHMMKDIRSIEDFEDVKNYFSLKKIIDSELSKSYVIVSKSRDLYSAAKANHIEDLVKKMSITPEEYASNVREQFLKYEPQNPEALPEEEAAKYVNKKMSSEDVVLKYARAILSYEIAKEPSIRKLMRQAYLRSATLTTNATLKGLSSEYLLGKDLDRLTNYPMSEFKVNFVKFLEVLEAEEEGFIEIKIELNEQDQDAVLGANYYFYSDQVNEKAEAWNYHRLLVMQGVKKHLQKSCRQSIRQHYKSFCELAVAGTYGEALYNRIMHNSVLHFNNLQIPSQVEHPPMIDHQQNFTVAFKNPNHQRNDPEIPSIKDFVGVTNFKIMVAVPGDNKEIPTVFTMISENGEFKDTLNWPAPIWSDKSFKAEPFLPRNQIDQSVEQNNQEVDLLNFIMQYNPDFMIVLTNRFESVSLFNAIDRLQEKLSKNHRSRMYYHDDEVATIFANSKSALEEFPKSSYSERCGIAVARLLNDPLVEYARLYNHDFDILKLQLMEQQHLLSRTVKMEFLERALINATTKIGLNINRVLRFPALQAPLQFVPGFGPRKAMDFLKKFSYFTSRDELKMAIGEVLFKNCASHFTLLKYSEEDADIPNPLDATRIHPEHYTLAAKICIDVYMNIYGSVSPSVSTNQQKSAEIISKVQDQYDDDGIFIGNADDPLDLIDFKGWADSVESTQGHILNTMYFIAKEIRVPFRDPRSYFKEYDIQRLFHAVTKETEKTLNRSNLRNMTIRYVSKRFMRGILDSGITIEVSNQEYSHSTHKNLQDDFQNGDDTLVSIISVDYERFLVYGDVSPRVIDAIQNEKEHLRASQEDEFKRRTQLSLNNTYEKKKITKRNIVHPYFKNISWEESKEYLSDKPVGDLVIRPSRRSHASLGVTYKFDTDRLVNISLREGIDPKTRGRYYKYLDQVYSDLDQVIRFVVDPLVEYGQLMMADPKFETLKKTEIEQLLRDEKKSNPRLIPYRIGHNDRRPGNFRLFYLPGNTNVLKEPIKVTVNGYQFSKELFKKPSRVISKFKSAYKQLQSYQDYRQKRKQASMEDDPQYQQQQQYMQQQQYQQQQQMPYQQQPPMGANPYAMQQQQQYPYQSHNPYQ